MDPKQTTGAAAQEWRLAGLVRNPAREFIGVRVEVGRTAQDWEQKNSTGLGAGLRVCYSTGIAVLGGLRVCYCITESAPLQRPL